MEGKIRPLRFPRDAGALERDTAVLVLGRTIGRVSIGMSLHEVERAYGTPRRSRHIKLGSRDTSAELDTFAVPGGSLAVTSVGGRVVGLSTGSAFYTTPQGFGVGSEVADGVGLTEKAWVTCKRAFQRNAGSVAVTFRPNRAKRKIAEVAMLRRAYDEPCKGSASGKR